MQRDIKRSLCIVWLQTPGIPLGDLRISRSRLHQTLLEHMPPHMVTYGATCVDAVLAQDGKGPVQLILKVYCLPSCSPCKMVVCSCLTTSRAMRW